MRAFHNDIKIKEKYLKRVITHRKADEIIKGEYWENGKGCAVGCTLHSSSHNAYETELGIPKELARLEDSIFEGLPLEIALDWPEKFLTYISVGADLSLVWPKFITWVLSDVFKYANPKGKIAIENVRDLFIRWINGDKPTYEEFIKAKKAAHAAAYAADAYGDAAATAAGDAAYAATAYAAAAAYGDAYAADATAYAAAAAAYGDAYAADAAARKKFWVKSSEELIRLLEECK